MVISRASTATPPSDGRPSAARTLPFLLAFACACTGSIQSGSAEGGGLGTGGTGGVGAGSEGPLPPANIVTAGCAYPDQRGSARESVRRLTKGELVASLRSLLGTELVERFVSSIRQIPEEQNLRTSQDLQPLHSQPFFDAYQTLVDQLSTAVAASTEERTRLGGSCFAEDPPTPACLSAFVSDFGRRVYRRPLVDAERTRLAGSLSVFVREGAASADAVYGLLFQLLQAKELLFHIEEGTGDTPVRIRLTDHEVASRISYSVLAGPPDLELMAAADAGQLGTLAAVQSQVSRLASSAAAQARFAEFFSGWLNMADIARPSLAVGTWAGIDVEGMDAELRVELEDFIGHVVWQKQADFRGLMTDSAVFPRSQRLADVYGVNTAAAGSPPAESQSHAGLPLHAGMMATSSIRTSIIRRGVFVLRRLLCDPIETPPSAIINARDEVVMHLEPTSVPNYEFVKLQTGAPTCMACHEKINPVGYVFEAFDQLGRPRATETSLDKLGNAVASFALPPGPFSLAIDEGVPSSFADAAGLVQLIADSDRARACMAANLALHLERRELAASDCGGADSFDQLKAGRSVLDAMLTAVANEDIFWRRPQ